MQAVPRISTGCSYFRQQLRSCSSASAAIQHKLREALVGSEWIEESADQAFLEAEPHRRGPKEEYRQRYQAFARQDLDSALQQWDELLDRLGPEEASKLREDTNAMLTVADSQLARDKLAAALRQNEERLKRKKEGQLKGMSLEHCS